MKTSAKHIGLVVGP